jgi:hypothetical protein
MALAAIGGKSHRTMVGCGGFAKRIPVAADALCREPEAIELPNRAHFVARVTVHRRMSADQRKPILVLIDVVDRNLPAVGVVAEFALRPILAAMKIRVAVLTFSRGTAKNQVRVAIDTVHDGVTPAQRKSGLRVFEFQLGAEWLPALGSMAILARNLELVAMRTISHVRIGLLTNPDAHTQRGREYKYEKAPYDLQTQFPG